MAKGHSVQKREDVHDLPEENFNDDVEAEFKILLEQKVKRLQVTYEECVAHHGFQKLRS